MDEYYDMHIDDVVELSGSDYRDQRGVIEPVFPVQVGFSDDLFSPTVLKKL